MANFSLIMHDEIDTAIGPNGLKLSIRPQVRIADLFF